MAQNNIARTSDAKKGFSWGWLIFGVIVVATVGGTIVIVKAIDKGPFGML